MSRLLHSDAKGRRGGAQIKPCCYYVGIGTIYTRLPLNLLRLAATDSQHSPFYGGGVLQRRRKADRYQRPRYMGMAFFAAILWQKVESNQGKAFSIVASCLLRKKIEL